MATQKFKKHVYASFGKSGNIVLLTYVVCVLPFFKLSVATPKRYYQFHIVHLMIMIRLEQVNGRGRSGKEKREGRGGKRRDRSGERGGGGYEEAL